MKRRTFLTAGTAGTLAASGTLGAHVGCAAVAEPDPVFALVEAERAAWSASDALSLAYSQADAAFRASRWCRKPRVLIGEYTAIVRGPDFDPIPQAIG